MRAASRTHTGDEDREARSTGRVGSIDDVIADGVSAVGIPGVSKSNEEERLAAANDMYYFTRSLCTPHRVGMLAEEQHRAELLDGLRAEIIDYVGTLIGVGKYTREVAKLVAAAPRKEGATIMEHAEQTMRKMAQCLRKQS